MPIVLCTLCSPPCKLRLTLSLTSRRANANVKAIRKSTNRSNTMGFWLTDFPAFSTAACMVANIERFTRGEGGAAFFCGAFALDAGWFLLVCPALELLLLEFEGVLFCEPAVRGLSSASLRLFSCSALASSFRRLSSSRRVCCISSSWRRWSSFSRIPSSSFSSFNV